MTTPTLKDIQDHLRRMENARRRLDFVMVNMNMEREADAVNKEFAEQIASGYRIEKILEPKTEMTHLDDAERSRSLKDAIAKIASKAHGSFGGFCFAPDVFKARIEEAVDPAHREFWTRQSSGLMVTLIKEKPEITEALKDDGILVWEASKWDPFDDFVRIVNTEWLTDEAEIHAFVVEPQALGKRCRFCTCLEPDRSLELQPVNAKERKRDVLMSDGKRVRAILQAGVVHCHKPCEPFWLAWVAKAAEMERAA